jgi:hypothetical protein
MWKLKSFQVCVAVEKGQILMKGEWKGANAGGRVLPDRKWLTNPKYLFSVSAPSKCVIVLAQPEKQSFLGIGFYLFKHDPATGEFLLCLIPEGC